MAERGNALSHNPEVCASFSSLGDEMDAGLDDRTTPERGL